MQVLSSFIYNNLFLFSGIVSFLVSLLSLKLLLPLFIKLKFLDIPNTRSNHDLPVALGGGLVVIPIIFIIAFLFNYQWSLINMLTMLALFFISIVDDFKSVKAFIRLKVHILLIALYVHFNLVNEIGTSTNINNNYLLFVIYALFILFIAWFINAFNFMDGIDGITSVQVVFLTLSLIFLNSYLGFNNSILYYVVIGTISGFLFFNWSPASIFLGDSGSIPLGFLMTHFLIEFALKGFWVSALILPMYYILDTAITLIIRIHKKEQFWKAHSQHFYQKYVRSGKTHKQVCLNIIILSLGLFTFALLSTIFKNNLIFLILAIFWCVFFLIIFSTKKNK